jgi:hypothetical protein
MSRSLIHFQMTRVISSPSSSTTVPLTLIFAPLAMTSRLQGSAFQLVTADETVLVRPVQRASTSSHSDRLAESPAQAM